VDPLASKIGIAPVLTCLFPVAPCNCHSLTREDLYIIDPLYIGAVAPKAQAKKTNYHLQIFIIYMFQLAAIHTLWYPSNFHHIYVSASRYTQCYTVWYDTPRALYLAVVHPCSVYNCLMMAAQSLLIANCCMVVCSIIALLSIFSHGAIMLQNGKKIKNLA